MKKITLYLFLLMGINALVKGQNLIPNPSFEENSDCPEKDRQMEPVTNWWSPFGSPCYFHECNNYQTEYRRIIPPGEKRFDVEPALPKTGKGYVGIYMSIVLYKGFQDYLMTKLISPLKKDEVYQVSMYVRLGDVWKYVNSFGVHFSKIKYQVNQRQLIDFNDNHQISSERVSLTFKEDTRLLTNGKRKLNSRNDWIKVEGEYKAKGGEQYVTIGNFHLVREFWNQNVPPKNKHEDFDYFSYMHSYYFIDDVSVTQIPLSKSKAYQIFAGSIEPEKKLVLENIYFDTGKASLQNTSIFTLRLLLTYMQENTKLSLQIHGHTDNVGNADANRVLSKERAGSIQEYLTTNGIDPSRIEAKGYGSLQAVADNNTAEGRQKNRRVEFILN